MPIYPVGKVAPLPCKLYPSSSLSIFPTTQPIGSGLVLVVAFVLGTAKRHNSGYRVKKYRKVKTAKGRGDDDV